VETHEAPVVQLLSLGAEAEKFARRRRRRSLAISIAVASVWVAMGMIRVDRYVIIKPGSADSVDRRLSVTGVATFAPKGDVLWATVGVIERPVAFQLIAGWISGSDDVPKRVDIYGKESQQDSRRISTLQMEGAKEVAEVVAARRLGFAVSGGGAEIAEIGKNYPAAKVLKPGDLITRVEGVDVCIQADVGTAMAGVKAGDTVSMTVVRAGKPVELEVPTVAIKEVPRPVIGVLLTAVTKNPCHPSFDAKIDTNRIGGPSAGLAMTLAILDRLSPGELSGGAKVAATGTIEGDGAVGEVGGIKQKTIAVKAAGAKLFLVPKSEVADALPHAGSMRVVGVATLDDALSALRQLGGAPLPRTPG
jgi:Lon-like protease